MYAAAAGVVLEFRGRVVSVDSETGNRLDRRITVAAIAPAAFDNRVQV
jgi:hypothetical protein